jgi:hypothetical protein
MTSTSDPAGHPGDSREQRECEGLILTLLGEELGISLTKGKISLRNGSTVEVDGCSPDRSVLCEVWAHQGAPKSAQKAKVMTDAAKLFVAGQALGGSMKKFVVLADAATADWFQGRSWMAEALRVMGVGIKVVNLPEEQRSLLREAQKRQFR